MEERLALVGQSADFGDTSPELGPIWEYMALLRQGSCRSIAIDALAPSSLSQLLRTPYVDFGRLLQLAKALRGSSTILGQSEDSGYRAALSLALSLSPSRLYIVFHGHRWWTRRNRRLAAFARGVRRVDFLCLSEALRDLVIREYGVPRSRVHVTGFGVDADFFSPHADPPSSCIVSAGTASRDYSLLVAACAGLDIPVKIAADSNWYKEDVNVNLHTLPERWRSSAPKLPGAARALCQRQLRRDPPARRNLRLWLCGHRRGDGHGQGGDRHQDPGAQRPHRRWGVWHLRASRRCRRHAARNRKTAV